MRKWRWILLAILVVLAVTGIVLRRHCRSLFSDSVHVTIQRVPTYWLRALIVSPLKPEWSFYWWQESSDPFSRWNALIRAMSETGPYAEGLLRRHLSSQNPEVRLFAALALLEMGDEGAEVQSQLRDLILLPQLPQSDDYYDVAAAYMAAQALAKRGEVVGFDYIASCLERKDPIGRRVRLDFEYVIGFLIDDLPEWDERGSDLYHLDYSRREPAYGERAREWYVRNREAIVRELSARRSIDSE